jgi:hypothetical protein
MAGGAYRYDSGAVCCSKGRVQTDGEREVSKEVGAELKFEALRRLFELRHRHDAGVVDQDVEWALPGIGESLDGPEIRQIKGLDVDGLVARRPA